MEPCIHCGKQIVRHPTQNVLVDVDAWTRHVCIPLGQIVLCTCDALVVIDGSGVRWECDNYEPHPLHDEEEPEPKQIGLD